LNYYAFHLGDYAAHTSHLDPLEDIAYRRLIDLHMLLERPLPLDVDELARKIRMRDHAATVRDVLNEFFIRTDDGWTNDRCMKEIAKYQSNKDAAKRAGQASAERRTQKKATPVERPLNDCSTQHSEHVEPTKNHKPRTNNQEPEQREANARGLRIPVDFPGPTELDWCESERPDLSAGTVALQFRDYHLAHGTAMKSWPAAWRTWVRKERLHAAARASPALTALDRQAEVIARITGTANRIVDIGGEIERPKLAASRN
jgi:uncharacterized protein YdaU (DUF1376 family)